MDRLLPEPHGDSGLLRHGQRVPAAPGERDLGFHFTAEGRSAGREQLEEVENLATNGGASKVKEGAPPAARPPRARRVLVRGASRDSAPAEGIAGRPAQSARARRRSKSPGARLLSLPSRLWMWAGIGLGVAFFILFGIVPAVANVVISFTNYSGLSGTPTSFTGFFNYIALFTSQAPGFTASIIDTLIFVLGVTVVQNVIGMLAGPPARRTILKRGQYCAHWPFSRSCWA